MTLNNKQQSASIGSLLAGNTPMTAEAMDAKREISIVNDFMLKLDQARVWICSVLGTEMDIAQFKEEIPKGVIFAQIAKAFDKNQQGRVFEAEKKEYRHVDNIVMFLDFCKKVKLNKHFLFETIDAYESKNIPKVIYCLHGLAAFLKKRGINSVGIVIDRNVRFSAEEAQLFSEELKDVKMPSYENLDSKLDSEDEENYKTVRKNTSKHVKEEQQTSKESTSAVLCKLFFNGLLWRRAFKNLKACVDVDVPTLRKFIKPSVLFDDSYKTISEQQKEIVEKFRINNRKEIEMDSLVHTIRLLHENSQRLRGVVCDPYPLANDFRSIKKVLFRLIHDQSLCYEILSAKSELPLRTLFPDTTMGDFLFSKFIRKNIHKNQEMLLNLAKTHFVSSRVFRNVSDVFRSTTDLELNPVHIYKTLYNKQVLLDDAIQNESVRREIVKRSKAIVEFVDAKFTYLLNSNLPYYVRIFADHPQFYEHFIEPAIEASSNHVIVEVMAQIFASDVHQPKVLERLVKENNALHRTNSIDYSDYAPLKDYLENCRTGGKSHRELLSQHQFIDVDTNEYFIECATTEDVLQVNISIEEINNVIVVLKNHLHKMPPEFSLIVEELGFIKASASGGQKIEIYSNFEGARIQSPIMINGKPDFDDKHKENREKYKEIEIKAGEDEEFSPREVTEKFSLRLDNQFSKELDLHDKDSTQLFGYRLKRNVLLLVLLSQKNSLFEVLNETADCEYDMLEQLHEQRDSSGCEIPLCAIEALPDLKKSVAYELSLIAKEKRISDVGQKLLDVLCREYVSTLYGSSSKEVQMNAETLDALFQKSCRLDVSLKSLYKYTNDLLQLTFTNKSGVFVNRQTVPFSKLGTYSIPFTQLQGRVYEDLDIQQMSVVFVCNEPMVLNVFVYFKGELLSGPNKLRFDSLLKMHEEKVSFVDISSMCCVSVGSLVDTINEKYIKY